MTTKECVQAFVTNTTVPKSLDELIDTVILNDEFTAMDDILYAGRGEDTVWTVPRWAKVGDVVFFMHAKTARLHLTALRTELGKRIERRDSGVMTTVDPFYGDDFRMHWPDGAPVDEDDGRKLLFWINHGLDVHRMYGGKIFAVGRVAGPPVNLGMYSSDRNHWGSSIYARIDGIWYLDEPVSIDEFRDFLKIQGQTAITPVFGPEYEKLMELIASRNKVPACYRGILVDELPFAKVGEDNWFEVMQRYRRRFVLEKQFRAYCVDYFLMGFGGRRSIHPEAMCRKEGRANAFVDNMVMYKGKWLPVEVKLNVDLEQDLEGQLDKYMGVDGVVSKGKVIGPDEVWRDRVMVIDTEGVYLYRGDALEPMIAWDDQETAFRAGMRLELALLEACAWNGAAEDEKERGCPRWR